MLPLVVRIGIIFGYYCLFCPWLVRFARTADGRRLGRQALCYSVAVGMVCVGGPVVLALHQLGAADRWVDGTALGFGGVFVVAFLIGVWLENTHRPRDFTETTTADVCSTFLAGGRPSESQMVQTPEADLIHLGAALVSRIDPWMSRDHADQLRSGVDDLLDDMARFPEYDQLASVVPYAIWGATGGPDYGHHFSYCPPTRPGERLGLFIALHGHGANVLLWVHAWRAFADEHRFVIVCPTFGYGNWEHPASVPCVERHKTFALDRWPIDPDRVYVGGISQGGAGVSNVAPDSSDYAGLLFFSGTMLPDQLRWTPAKTRVFVSYGGEDHNVSPRSVEAGVRVLTDRGAAVTVVHDPEADHFHFFARRRELFAQIGAWMRAG